MKPKALTLLFFLIFQISFSQGPAFNWAQSIGSSGIDDYSRVIAVDNLKNSYIAGNFIYSPNFDFDPSPATYTLNSLAGIGYFAKYDSLGALVWAKNFGPSIPSFPLNFVATDLKFDKVGNLVLAGAYSGSGDFDPSPINSYIISNTTTPNYGLWPLLIKFDVNGNFLAASEIGQAVVGNIGQGTVHAIDFDKFNNIIVTGYFSGVLDFDPSAGTTTLQTMIGTTPSGGGSFLAKYDSSWNYTWARSLELNNPTSVAVDTNGTIFLCGVFSFVKDFDPSPATFTLASHSGSDDIFVSKYTSAGIFVSAIEMGSAGLERCNSIKVDKFKSVYITGSFVNSVDFNPSMAVNQLTITGNDFLTTDIYIAKYDSSLNYVWAINNGLGFSDGAEEMILDKDNNCIAFGISQTASGPYSSAILIKYTSTGNFLSKILFGGTSQTRGFAIANDTVSNNLFVTGIYNGTTDFNPYLPTYSITSQNNSVNLFLSRFSPCQLSSVPMLTLSGSNICAGQTVSLSINSGSLNGGESWDWSINSCSNTSIDSGTMIAVAPTVTTVYYAKGQGGCTFSASACQAITVSVLPSPLLSISGPTSACEGDTIVLVASGAQTYTWSGGNTGNSLSLSSPGYSIVSVSGTSALFPCASTMSLPIVINPIYDLYTLNDTADVCSGSSIVLSAFGANTYTWSTGNTQQYLTVSPTVNTTYIVKGTDFSGCITKADTIQVIVLPLSTLSISGATSSCSGETVTLVANGGNTYNWNTGSSQPSLTVSPITNTVFIVSGIGLNNCYAIADTFSIVVYPNPTLAVSGSSIICAGDGFVLTASGSISYTWSSASGVIGTGPIYSSSSNMYTSYTVTGENQYNCKSSSTFSIQEESCTGLQNQNIKEGTILYPNPTSGIFTIKIPDFSNSNIELLLFTGLGQAILKKQLVGINTTIDLSNYSGIVFYFVKKDSEIISTGKLVIE